MTKTKTPNKILEEDLQTIGLEDDVRADYTFDFNFLKKQRRKEKIKMIALSVMIVVLICLVVVLGVSHQKLNQSYNQLLTQQNEKETSAGIICCTTMTVEELKTCKCPKKEMVKDSKGSCRDVRFAIQFSEERTIQDVLHPKDITYMPQINNLTICLWLNPALPQNKSSIFNFYSYHSKAKNILRLYLQNMSLYSVVGDEMTLLVDKIPESKWTHLCYYWQVAGNYSVFINGSAYGRNASRSLQIFNSQPLSASHGDFLLGQNSYANKDDNYFVGTITSFYVYSRQLDSNEIHESFHDNPPKNDVVFGWWNFKGQADSSNIKEVDFPFS